MEGPILEGPYGPAGYYFLGANYSNNTEFGDTSQSWSERIAAYCFLFFFFVGIIGNTLNLCVLNRREMRAIQTNTNRFLSAMAVADLGFFVTMLPLKAKEFPFVNALFPGVDNYFVIVVWLVMPVVNFFSTASIWLAIAVSVERLLAVRNPLHMNSIEHSGQVRVRCLIVGMYLFAGAINIYQFYSYKAIASPCVDDTNSTTSDYPNENYTYEYYYVNYLCFINDLDPLEAKLTVMSNALFLLLAFVVPLLLLTVIGIALMYYLRQSGRFLLDQQTPQHLRRVKKRERRALCMILVTVFSFVIFNILSGLTRCVIAWYNFTKKEIPLFWTTSQLVSNELVACGKAVNFLLYCSANYSYRKQLLFLLLLPRVACIRKRLPARYIAPSSAHNATELRQRFHNYRYSAIGSVASSPLLGYPLAVRRQLFKNSSNTIATASFEGQPNQASSNWLKPNSDMTVHRCVSVPESRKEPE